MARIALDIAASQLSKAQKLVDAGVYESLQQLGEIAFANQLALEDGADPEDLADVARGRRAARKIPPLPPPTAERPKRPPPKVKGNTKTKAAKTPSKPHDKDSESSKTLEAPSPPSFEGIRAHLNLPGSTAVAPLATTVAPSDLRVLGLVNKPFGLKLVARAAMSATKEKKWASAELVAKDVNIAANVIGAEVAGEDRAAERTRNLLQIGLPTKDNDEPNQRFATQYVGRIARTGQVTPGAIVQFALAAIVDGALVLTEAGAGFSRIANPVLDGDVRPWERMLSRDEQAFLIKHIAQYVPMEAADTHAVVRSIGDGHDKPEALLVAIKPLLPSTWSELQTRSYLSGLVTRLAELDVISRVWTGRHVHYELGPNALLVQQVHAQKVA